MVSKIRKQIIKCPSRNREVEVTYAVSGSWYAPEYDIVACPAMYESSQSCNRKCQSQLAHSPKYLISDMCRV